MKELADELNELVAKIENSADNNDEEDIENFNLFLEKTIELRNRLEKKMKYSSPTKKRILRLQIIDLDNRIAQYKHGFKDFKGKCEEEKQVKAKKKAELDKLFDEADLKVAKMYIIAKYQAPKSFFNGLHHSIVDNLPPELVKEFYERVAYLEKTKLKEILAGK